MAIMVIPLPAPALDILLSLSVSMSLLVLLVTLYVKNPVEFTVFPMVLLATTLFRLALNVATTRLILLNGSEGPDAAGHVVRTFGEVVVGGSYVVGLVVFAILIVINFVVITKGAGRIAEVAARFTLDAMPGKQMAVDAELNAGLIDEKAAKKRREGIAREADFYGSMDGASKFIRGDAVAGILITLINIVGGIIIGVVQKDMPLKEAVQVYTVLTIGDGLLSQVPALIISAAAGMLVTRVPDTDEQSLPAQFGHQLFGSHRALAMLSASLMGFMALPGLRLPFFLLAAVAAFGAWRGWKADQEPKPKVAEQLEGVAVPEKAGEPPVETLLRVEPLAIELGVDLIGLVDEKKGGNLVERIQRIRRQVAQDTGLLVPPVHLRDNLRLEGSEYRVLLRGEEVGRGKVTPRQLLAINPGDASGNLRGHRTRDPVFGLEALWISESLRQKAQEAGYTVVDVPTVVTTHLTEVLNQHGHELFGRQQLADLLDRIQVDNPRLVEELIPEPLSRSVVLRVFRNLLREGVAIRDAQSILEAMADHAPRVRDADALTEFVRQRLSRHITRRYSGEAGVVNYIGLAADAEEALSSSVTSGEGGALNLALDPEDARRLLISLRNVSEQWRGSADLVLLVPPLVRGPLRRLTEKLLPRVAVLSPGELLPTVRLERVAAVSLKSAGA
jgi:flagellar biosynthesis protein FlhA